MSTPLLSAFYFGSVEHYALLARHPRVIIDIGEYYERQSHRTRTSIIGPNGVQHLNVQIVRRSHEKMPLHTVGLSYVESWPQQHLHAIRSAYGQTPWFIHYIDAIEDVLSVRHERLADLLFATMRLGMKWLGLGTELEVSEKYVEVSGEHRAASGGSAECLSERSRGDGRPATRHSPLDTSHSLLDLRTTLHPKKPLPPEVPATPLYPQVFADRHGFVPRMSVIDLVCNCGPEAGRIIRP
ncbi:MAG: WbqC family protein [Flavobacteriales bacterium]|nr:WbqC family protein [Flavobacteriales bacterium]